MSKYTKKPVAVEAFRFGFETYPDWFIEKVKDNHVIIYADKKNHSLSSFLIIRTGKIGGDTTGIFGDYIIQDVYGEINRCNPEIFEKTYEPVN